MIRRIVLIASLAVCLTVPAGCLGPLDTLGMDSFSGNREDQSKDPNLEDDRIEDKNPSCDATPVQEEFGGCTFTLDKSCTVTKLDIVPFEDDEAYLETRLFATRETALTELEGRPLIPSMEVVNGALKPFNDGLYASVEIGVQDGIPGVYQSKRQFLHDLAGALDTEYALAAGDQRTHLGSALRFVAGGLIAGGNDATPLNIDASVLAQAQTDANAFLADGLKSNPIGFYTWNPTLEEIFRQDRYFQNLLHEEDTSEGEFGKFAALAAVIEADPNLRQTYENILAVYAGLTNPYASHTAATLFDYVDGLASLDNVATVRQNFLADHSNPYVCNGTYLALFPSSRSKDTDFFLGRYCSSGVPSNENLMDVLIEAIRDGTLDLSPDPNSGWYDYQVYALETLLLPERGVESDHLLLTAAYKKKLIETFKSIITQTRETHVKQLQAFGVAGSAVEPKEVDIYPKFPVEPFPTFYLRTARAYRFLETYLLAALGADFLASTVRFKPQPPQPGQPLGEELRQTIRLTYGLYILSARAVGLAPERYLLQEEMLEFPVADCVETANEWLAGWKTDDDILTDPRVIVPIGEDTGTGTAIYWAILGVKALKIWAEFVEGYEPSVVSIEGNCELRDILDHHYYLLVEEMREVRISSSCAPPTRDEFRQVCDQHDNADDIVNALENGPCP